MEFEIKKYDTETRDGEALKIFTLFQSRRLVYAVQEKLVNDSNPIRILNLSNMLQSLHRCLKNMTSFR